MSRNRWRVVRTQFPWPDPHYRWVAQQWNDDDHSWWPTDIHSSSWEETLRLARQAADEQARTITVTLPRVEGRRPVMSRKHVLGVDPLTYVGQDDDGHYVRNLYPDGDVEEVYLYPDELEPVALRLLALDRKGSQ